MSEVVDAKPKSKIVDGVEDEPERLADVDTGKARPSWGKAATACVPEPRL